MSSFYRQQLEEYLGNLEVVAKMVADIGGAQGPAAGRCKKWQVAQYDIYDLPEFDIEEQDTLDLYDVVFCLEVFEYLVRPLDALENINLSLNDGGIAYITFAFAYPHHEELEYDSLRYTETGVRRLADMAGFDIRNITYRVDKSGLLKAFYAADKMHPSRNYPHHEVTGFIVELKKR